MEADLDPYPRRITNGPKSPRNIIVPTQSSHSTVFVPRIVQPAFSSTTNFTNLPFIVPLKMNHSVVPVRPVSPKRSVATGPVVRIVPVRPVSSNRFVPTATVVRIVPTRPITPNRPVSAARPTISVGSIPIIPIIATPIPRLPSPIPIMAVNLLRNPNVPILTSSPSPSTSLPSSPRRLRPGAAMSARPVSPIGNKRGLVGNIIPIQSSTPVLVPIVHLISTHERILSPNISRIQYTGTSMPYR